MEVVAGHHTVAEEHRLEEKHVTPRPRKAAEAKDPKKGFLGRLFS